MKLLFFLLFIINSNLSYSYENNQLLLNNEPKKINDIELETIEGDKKKIFQNKKKIYLLNFWATWCPPCVKEIPELIELGEIYHKDIEVIFISVDSNPKKIPKFLKKHNFQDINIFFDNKLNLSKSLEVKIMPTTLVINKELEEISRVKGYIDWLSKDVLKKFEELL